MFDRVTGEKIIELKLVTAFVYISKSSLALLSKIILESSNIFISINITGQG